MSTDHLWPDEPSNFNKRDRDVKRLYAELTSEIPEASWSGFPGEKVGASPKADIPPVQLRPQELIGARIKLLPLSLDTFQELRWRTRKEPFLFEYLDLDAASGQALDAWFIRVFQSQTKREAQHFVIHSMDTGEAIGHTAVTGIRPEHCRCEISWTWLLTAAQGFGYARESKLVLKDRLFEAGFHRIQIVVDEANKKSIRSIESSGAKLDGIMPKAQKRRDGTFRNTVIYSLTTD